MKGLFKKQLRRLKRHISKYSSHSIHSRTHFSGPWKRRELKESPIHGPLKKVSPLKLLPLGRRAVEKNNVYNSDSYLLFYCYHFIYSEELFYGHIGMMVIIAQGKANFLIRLLQANRDNKLEITHFKFLKMLGSGSYGTVFLALHPTRGELVAVKKILAVTMDINQARDALRIMIEKEASCHVQGSAHVVQLIDTFTVTSGIHQAFYFVYEYADRGDLMDLITKIHDNVDPEIKSSLFDEGLWPESIEMNPNIMLFTKYVSPQILLGLSALHERGIIHLDLKPENILVNKGGVVKISDLGLVKRYRWFHYSARAEFLTSLRREVSDVPSEDENYIAGSMPYMEPQLRGRYIPEHINIPNGLFDYKVTFSADYFSVGIIIFHIMTGFIYGYKGSYSAQRARPLYDFLNKYKSLPLVAWDAYKTILTPELFKKLTAIARDNVFLNADDRDGGIVDLLMSTCQLRKKRWSKYTIPVKVVREGHKVEENVLCINKIKHEIALFRDVNWKALNAHGMPPAILEFLDKPEPIYQEYHTIDQINSGMFASREAVYKWPYIDFHMPLDVSGEEPSKRSEITDHLLPEDFNFFRDSSLRSLRLHENEVSESESASYRC